MFILLPFLRLVTVRSKRRGKVFDRSLPRHGKEWLRVYDDVAISYNNRT